MWLAHYGFHFVTGAATCLAAVARFSSDWGLLVANPDRLVASCCAVEPPGWLVRGEILCLDVGLLASLYFSYRISVEKLGMTRRAVGAFLPWGMLAVLLFLVGVAILVAPMEMRGTLPVIGLSRGGAG